MSDTTMTVRGSAIALDIFKKLAKEKKISQGKLIEELMNNYKNVNDKTTGIFSGNDNTYTFLLRYQDYISNNHLETRKFICKGEKIYESSFIKINKNKIEDKFKDKLNKDYDHMRYSFCIIKEDNSGKFIIHQNFYIGDIDNCVFNIMNIQFAANYHEVMNIIGRYAREKDKDDIGLLLADRITTDELEDYWKI